MLGGLKLLQISAAAADDNSINSNALSSGAIYGFKFLCMWGFMCSPVVVKVSNLQFY